MDRHLMRKCALLSAVGACIGAAALSASAANLLTNPGFEAPASGATATGWTFYSNALRANFDGPDGNFDVWLETWEAGQGGVYQNFSDGVVANTTYTASGNFFFETASPTTNATVDVGLTWIDSGNNEISADFDNISLSSVTTGAWTPESFSAVAPAGTKTVQVSFDYFDSTGGSGACSVIVDDADLEGAGNPPTIATWSVVGSGDWNVAGNWSTAKIPNAIDAAVDFLGAITQNQNVYTDVPVIVGSMTFTNPKSYVIDGAGSITLQVSTGHASVTVTQGTQEINVPLTLASNTVLNVSGGATLVMADPISINSGLTLTQTGGGTVTYESTITVGSSSSIAFGNSTHAHALTLQSTGSASIGGTGTVLTLDSLSLASGAKLDIGKGEASITYLGASPASTIGAELKTAYASGAWTGSGITSSAASFAQGTSVGYYDTGTQVNVERTWIGDLDLNGVINNADYLLMGSTGSGWQHGDLNYDGVINADDYSLFAYGAEIAGSRNVSSVPEPGALGLLIVAGLLARRRRA